MKPIQKYIIIFVGFLIFLSLGYIGLQKSNAPISQSDIDVTATKSSTPKPSSTLSGSETVWGNNPFQTGDTNIGEVQKIAIQNEVFQKPNTEWKTRTLSGITYVFGEGNPKEVALDEDQMKNYILCRAPYLDASYGNIDGQCKEDRGYVTPEIEKSLLRILLDQNWIMLATKCEKNFRSVETIDTQINGRNDPDFLYFDRVFSSSLLDVNNFITIDPNTGLKILQINKLRNLSLFIANASQYGMRKIDGHINPYGDCVDQYGTEIVRQIFILENKYRTPMSNRE